MIHYTDLAFRYIKTNKKRSLITVIGVSISVMFLYMLLNLFLSYLLNYRAYLRENYDFEMVFFTENEQQINDILNDPWVKDGTVADYYKYNYYGSTNYNNALYINTTNPYRINKIFEDIKSKYGVEGRIHYEMAATYLQGDEGNIIYVAILIALLISYIIAIFGVGLIRNSIQLNMLERIKDFGQLRCIGSTKGQMRWIIYLQGLILELGGIICGTVMGVIGSLIIGDMVSWKHTGFHFIPLAFVMIAYLGDLYFAMNENAKLAADMTPVSAIRGEYRIKKERLRRRKSRLFGRLFGLNGDYAYKNIKRNPGRFYRTISAMTLGIAASIVIFGVLSTLAKYKEFQDEDNGYYHVYYEHTLMPWETESELMNSLPKFDKMQQVSEMQGMESAKRIYTALVSTTDWEKYVADRYLQEYMDSADGGFLSENYDENIIPDYEDFAARNKMEASSVAVCGYDEEDMARYQDTLIDGRLPENDNEMLMVVSNYTYVYDELSDDEYEKFQRFLDYKVGDTIDIVNPISFRELLSEEMQPVTEEYETESKELERKRDEAEKNNDEETYNEMKKKLDKLDGKYYQDIERIKGKCYREMLEKEDYVTYTICGIVEGDANQGRRLSNTFMGKTGVFYEPVITIVTKEQYMKLLGVDEDWISGMQYHFDKLNVSRYNDIDPQGMDEDWVFSDNIGYSDEYYGYSYICSPYPLWVEYMQGIKRYVYGAGVVVLFIVVMSVVNTINATASNLFMRKKELAQLRVLGASKSDIFRMVMFEGVLEAVIACLLGTVLGTGLSLGVYNGVFGVFTATRYVFPWIAAILSVFVVSLILCGVVYVPLKQMPMNVASDLATAGE